MEGEKPRLRVDPQENVIEDNLFSLKDEHERVSCYVNIPGLVKERKS